MNENRDRDLHPLLCAYLLNELDADDRALVERALADDSALREERARLESVLGMVKDAFPRDRALTDASRAALVAEAERCVATAAASGSRVWATGAVALAAALLVAVAVKLAAPTGAPRAPASEDVERRQAVAPAFEAVPGTFDVTEGKSVPADEADGPDPGPPVMAPNSTSSYAVRYEREPVGSAAPTTPGPDLTAGGLYATSTRGGGRFRGPSDGVPPGRAGNGSTVNVIHAHGALPPASSPTGPLGSPTPGIVDGRSAYARIEPGANAAIRDELRALFATTEVKIQTGLSVESLVRDDPEARFGLDYVEDTDVPALSVADAKALADAFIADCRRRPHERPSMMYFRFWGDNAFVLAGLDPLSTFSADVDTASYALARRYLTDGLLPEKAQIRTEEFLNYFKPDIAPPTEGTFAIDLEAAPSLFGGTPDRWLLRVTLRGREVPEVERLPQRLTFVVDTSGSMKEENRIELVKHALRLLVAEMRPNDHIALVRFANDASLILPMTPVASRSVIEQAIHSLAADGGTNAEAGLKLGYAQAAQSVDPEAISRVILLSDGVANIGQTDQDRINTDVAAFRAQGIYLNTVGVGMGNDNDVFLEQLADKGDGLCNYVDSEREARRALVDNFVGALVPIARDVKIQVEFDPELVLRYRLLGYENRAIADADFRNAAVDAGEVGSGHQVTALYEIEPGAVVGAGARTFATARVRYKPPHGQGDVESELGSSIAVGAVKASYEAGSPGFRRSTLVAQFAEFLRRSTHAHGDSLDLLFHESTKLAAEGQDDDVTEFSRLVERCRALVVAAPLPADDPLTQAIDAVRRNAILRAELEDLSRADDRELLEKLEQENRRLEERIHELLEKRFGRTR